MGQNMMASEHKTTNKIYRINYELIFRKRKKGEKNEIQQKRHRKK